MSEELTIWIENTIAGFLYAIAGFFLFLFFCGINDLPKLDNLKEYLPYIFLGIIAFSSVLGFSAQKILENIIYLFYPKYKYSAFEDKKFLVTLSEPLQKRLHNLYVVLILYRHLILGTIAIWISLLCWFLSSEKIEYIFTVSIFSILLLAIFIITYILHKKTFSEFKDEVAKGTV